MHSKTINRINVPYKVLFMILPRQPYIFVIVEFFLEVIREQEDFNLKK